MSNENTVRITNAWDKRTYNWLGVNCLPTGSQTQTQTHTHRQTWQTHTHTHTLDMGHSKIIRRVAERVKDKMPSQNTSLKKSSVQNRQNHGRWIPPPLTNTIRSTGVSDCVCHGFRQSFVPNSIAYVLEGISCLGNLTSQPTFNKFHNNVKYNL